MRILGRGYDISEMIMNQVFTKHWKYPSIKIVQTSQINIDIIRCNYIYNQMQLYIYIYIYMRSDIHLANSQSEKNAFIPTQFTQAIRIKFQ